MYLPSAKPYMSRTSPQGRYYLPHFANEKMVKRTQTPCRKQKEEGGGVGLVRRLGSIIRIKAQERQHILSMSYLGHCLTATQGIFNLTGESAFV